jgi:surface antigen
MTFDDTERRRASMSTIGSFSVISGFFCALALCGCNAAAPEAAAVAPAAPELPAPGVIGSALGRELDAADRETAIAAQQEAVNSGRRKSWRGAHGVYGFVEPAPEDVVGGCRDYTHKVYVDGRPRQGAGRACKRPDGTYRITS